MGGNIKLKKDKIKEIETLKSDFDLLDTWRAKNPSFRKFSWRRTKPVTLRELSFFTSGGSGGKWGGSHENISIKRGDHKKIFLI